MKNLQVMSWGLALAALTACVNLDEQLVGTVTTTYFTTPAGLEAAVDGDYAQLRDFFGREEAFAVTEFGTDLTTNGDQGGYQFENTYAAGLNASALHYQFPWTSFYRGINTSNAVIERAPAVTGMDAAIKASRIAEAKFLRALSYFWLVQMYGPAPLPLTESQGASNVAHRSPVDSIYLQIVKDLRDAITALPVTQSQVGRATQGAARHLLAKVLLTRAYHPYAYEAANTDFYVSGPAFLREPGMTSATDFAAARAEADSVIAGPYALLPNYVEIFCAPMGARGPGSYCNVPANETNSEVIWSVQFTTTAGLFNAGGGNALFVQMLSFYDDRQGMTRDCNNGRGFRRSQPSHRRAVRHLPIPDDEEVAGRGAAGLQQPGRRARRAPDAARRDVLARRRSRAGGGRPGGRARVHRDAPAAGRELRRLRGGGGEPGADRRRHAHAGHDRPRVHPGRARPRAVRRADAVARPRPHRPVAPHRGRQLAGLAVTRRVLQRGEAPPQADPADPDRPDRRRHPRVPAEPGVLMGRA